MCIRDSYTDATRGALGPCQLAQLRVLWVSGIITRDTSIWREGLGSWLPVHAMTEVAAVLLPLSQPPVAVQSAPWYHLDASGQRSPAGLSPAGLSPEDSKGVAGAVFTPTGLTPLMRRRMAYSV